MGYVSFMGSFTPKKLEFAGFLWNLLLSRVGFSCFMASAPWCLAHWAKSKHCAKASGFPPAK